MRHILILRTLRFKSLLRDCAVASFVVTLAFCLGCIERDPRLFEVQKDRSFVFEDNLFQNGLFGLDAQSLVPICGIEGDAAKVCDGKDGAFRYIKKVDIKEVSRDVDSNTWVLHLIKRLDSTIEIFVKTKFETALKKSRPSLFAEYDRSNHSIKINMTPVVPSVDFSVSQGFSIFKEVRWARDNQYSTAISIPLKPDVDVTGIDFNWNADPSSFKVFVRNSQNKKTEDKVRIVLDPGHGFIEGTCHEGLCESQMVLEIAEALKGKLVDKFKGKVEVTLTRNDNSHFSLLDRIKIAETTKPDLFVSLHLDYWKSGGKILEQPLGLSCYYFTSLSSKYAEDICDYMKLEKFKVSWYSQRKLYVLHSQKFPSVLLELGNLLDAEDRQLFQKPELLDKYVNSIAKSIQFSLNNRQMRIRP